MHLDIVIPVFGDQSDNFDSLINSIEIQDCKESYHFHIAEDVIPDEMRLKYQSLDPSLYSFYPNNTGKQLFALQNICRVLDSLSKESIIGIIDGDDHLIGDDCFEKIHKYHNEGFPVVWTANEWDLNGMNHSGPLDDGQNVYDHPWVSSHFRTFRLGLYQSISPVNFQNDDGQFFEKCYDQALMLPIIHMAHILGYKTKYIPQVHYAYKGRIDHESEGRELQLSYEKFIRKRGYVA